MVDHIAIETLTPVEFRQIELILNQPPAQYKGPAGPFIFHPNRDELRVLEEYLRSKGTSYKVCETRRWDPAVRKDARP